MDFCFPAMIVSTSEMKEVELVSFDAEGTVVTPDFSQAIWHEAIPALYARRKGLDLAEAKMRVFEEYNRIGEQSLEWYDIEYWFDYLGLGASAPVIQSCLGRITYYPEVTQVLSSLASEYRLVVASCTPRELLHYLLQDIESYFVRVFSSISHYKQVKNPDFYLRICEEMGVHPGHVIHVGDNWQFDYINSRKVGIDAFYLDRSGSNCQESISDLTQLERILLLSR